jgi:hypothetical protein
MPQQNGVAERKNRTLVEMARCMLYSKRLHKTIWVEAICFVNFILNRFPTKQVMHVIPEEKWNGRKLNINNFNIFGSECWAHIPDEKWQKLEPKSHKFIFIGYVEDSKAYRLFDPSTQSVIIRRDVHFNGISPPPKSIEPHVTLHVSLSHVTPISIRYSSIFVPTFYMISPSSSSIPHEYPEAPEVTYVSSHLLIWARKTLEFAGSEIVHPLNTRRTRSNFALVTKVLATYDPTTYAQAKGHPHWEQSMIVEYESLIKKDMEYDSPSSGKELNWL